MRPITIEAQLGWDADYEDLIMELRLPVPLTQEQEARLKRLVEAWFEVGYYGGYGGNLLHPLIIDFGECGETRCLDISLDPSGATDLQKALNVLTECLATFGESEQLEMGKLVLLG